ncbi:hypothetical protein, partial [Bacteroides thetaiotaomicron]|uniref:hypothetical protein n=1 Tax=Bacteroides thetaiotaomicron TaxID=818 RepID=UPI001F46B987
MPGGTNITRGKYSGYITDTPISSVTSTMTGILATCSGRSANGAGTSAAPWWRPATGRTTLPYPTSWTSSSVTTCPMNKSVMPRNAGCARH